jgi:hypothetical protein
MIFCWKCRDSFYKEERLNKHAAKCKGVRCRVCGQTGHLACARLVPGTELQQKVKEKLAKGEQVTIVGLFD